MFDLGMEELALRIARHLDLFVWMHEERLKFYRKMIDHNNNYRDTLVGQLMRRVDENPAKASIHLMNVDDINVSVCEFSFRFIAYFRLRIKSSSFSLVSASVHEPTRAWYVSSGASDSATWIG